jgi:hypothetical protein
MTLVWEIFVACYSESFSMCVILTNPPSLGERDGLRAAAAFGSMGNKAAIKAKAPNRAAHT